MHIYYEESIFRSNTKEVLIGFTEFLCKLIEIPKQCVQLKSVHPLAASTGGLLGLFMGFSVVSLIEIVYFVTLRPFCVRRQRHNSERQPSVAGDQKLLTSVRTNRDVSIVGMWFMSSAAKPTKPTAPPTVTDVQPCRTAAAVGTIDVVSPVVMTSVSRRMRGLIDCSWQRTIGAEEVTSAVERGKFSKHYNNLQSFPYTE